MSIVLDSVGLRAGTFRVDGLSFHVAEASYAVLMGRTGCGKTTLLETICGLQPAASGRIVLGGTDVTGAPPAARGIGYVPQDGALFPTMTVRDHLRFSLALRRWSRKDTLRRVEELAEMLGLSRLLGRRPGGLSGGERQRVALGRALAARPAVLLLDEPLSALDDDARDEMYELLRSLREHTQVTTLHVTHNGREAARLADRILRLDRTGLQEDREGLSRG